MLRELEISLNPNKLVQYLKKPAREFTQHDLIQFIEAHQIEMVNFRYVAEDGKLKTLNFVITSKAYLESILSTGERVDGSSLFSFIEAGSSDLYVIPRYKTAFLNPFNDRPTLDILCSFYTADGLPLESAPEHILRKAHRHFQRTTGYTFKAMGELEYYVIAPVRGVYPSFDQRGYHSSPPFSKWEALRLEALQLIAQAGGKIKYGHGEVGNFVRDGVEYEQHEIEFLPTEAEEAVDQLVIAKWILRMLGERHGVLITFAPKITVGKAGSGLHIHMQLEKNGENQMVKAGRLSLVARKMIAGILDAADALTAFGNTTPVSYLRLVPHQEAPTNICWGDKNRSVLVRVPLGWIGKTQMVRDANPQQATPVPYIPGKQTVEFRAPDGSADLYHLMAGLIVAAEHGLQMPDALELAERTYVNVNIFREENRDKQAALQHLPQSCAASADCLEAKRGLFERDGVFPVGTVQRFIDQLRRFDDRRLSETLYNQDEKIGQLVHTYLHWM